MKFFKFMMHYFQLPNMVMTAEQIAAHKNHPVEEVSLSIGGMNIPPIPYYLVKPRCNVFVFCKTPFQASMLKLGLHQDNVDVRRLAFKTDIGSVKAQNEIHDNALVIKAFLDNDLGGGLFIF